MNNQDRQQKVLEDWHKKRDREEDFGLQKAQDYYQASRLTEEKFLYFIEGIVFATLALSIKFPNQAFHSFLYTTALIMLFIAAIIGIVILYSTKEFYNREVRAWERIARRLPPELEFGTQKKRSWLTIKLLKSKRLFLWWGPRNMLIIMYMIIVLSGLLVLGISIYTFPEQVNPLNPNELIKVK